MIKRFDVVIWNYNRLQSLFDNIQRLRNLDKTRDRITVVSGSPSSAEAASVRAFTESTGIESRYLVRVNRGLAELARAEYFTGNVGTLDDNLSHEFIFQMQEHYLDTGSSYSRYPHGDVKGDVVPDGAVFDLDNIERLAEGLRLDVLFCDRLNPCWFKLGGSCYIAPNGGNFIIRSAEIRRPSAQSFIGRLMESCDNTYDWAVFAEYMWGYLFFKPGTRTYDLRRGRLFTSFPRGSFYVHNGPSNPRFREVYGKYHSALGLPHAVFVWEPAFDYAIELARRCKRTFARYCRQSMGV